MRRVLNYFLGLFIFVVVTFLVWEWWQSYPRLRPVPIVKAVGVEQRIDSVLNHSIAQYLLPGISVGVVKGGKIIYTKAFGFGNLAIKDSLLPESTVPIASVSKIFTALAVAAVFGEKGMTQDSYLSQLDLPDELQDSLFGKLRLRDLLSHQSGLTDPGIVKRLVTQRHKGELKELGEQLLPLSFEWENAVPYHYADVNFDLLGFLLEESERIPFGELVTSAVFEPSAMGNSSFISEWPLENSSLAGYQRTFLWKRLKTRRTDFGRYPSPSSGMVSTSRDMCLNLIHLLRGEMGVYQQPLQWLKVSDEDVPLGFQKIRVGAEELPGHLGEQGGYSSILVYSEPEDIGLFVFFNARDHDNARIAVATAILSILKTR